MNYKSELRGFCFDRALHYHEKMGEKATLAQVCAASDELTEYFYIADKDFADAGAHIVALADTVSIDDLADLVNALSNIHDRRAKQAARLAEKVQQSLTTQVEQ